MSVASSFKDSSAEMVMVNGQAIKYLSRVSRRAKRLRLALYIDGRLVVTRPCWVSSKAAEDFLKEKSDWVLVRLKSLSGQPRPLLASNTRADYLARRETARSLVLDLIAKWNQSYHFEFSTVSIRNQATRWGSCSKKGGLNFNYRLLDLPPRVADYIIVHELCHLKEFNHSARFWSLVARALPDYKELRRAMHGALA